MTTSSDYILTLDPWGYWPFDDALGATEITDLSGNNRPLLAVNSIALEQPGLGTGTGTAGTLNGTDSQLRLSTTHSQELPFVGRGPFTVRIAVNRLGTAGRLFSLYEYTNNTGVQIILIGTDLRVSRNSDTAIIPGVNTDEWRDIAITYDGTTLNIYIDNGTEMLLRHSFDSITDVPINTWNAAAIGYDYVLGSQHLNASVDEVVILDYAASKEVLDDMTLARNEVEGPPPPEPEPEPEPVETGTEGPWSKVSLAEWVTEDSGIFQPYTGYVLKDGTSPAGPHIRYGPRTSLNPTSYSVLVRAATDDSPRWQESFDGGVTWGATRNPQDIINSAGTNATIAFQYDPEHDFRITSSLAPISGQKWVGFAGARINGSQLTKGADWIHDQANNRWYINNQTLRARDPQQDIWPEQHGSTSCELEVAKQYGGMCRKADSVYMNDDFLQQMETLGEGGPGKWFFDYSTDRIYIWNDPNKNKIELGRSDGIIKSVSAPWEIYNLHISKSINPLQSAMITVNSGQYLHNCVIRLSHGTGCSVYGSTTNRGRAEYNESCDNGQFGFAGAAAGRVAYNNNHHNNHRAIKANRFWWAGGTKFGAHSDGMQIVGNWSHHNYGVGCAFDISNRNYYIADNVFEQNEGTGLVTEIGYGGRITNNMLRYNNTNHIGNYAKWWADDGILIFNDSNVEIDNNIIVGGGIAMRMDYNRSTWNLADIDVHDNDHYDHSITGITMESIATHPNIQYRGNRYFDVDASAGKWKRPGSSGLGSFAQWQAEGYDTSGSVASSGYTGG